MNKMPDDQNHLSRSNSMNRMDDGVGAPGGRGMSGSVMGDNQPYGGDVGNPMGAQQIPSYSMPQDQNGMPMHGGFTQMQQLSRYWTQLFQAGAHQPDVNNAFPPKS
jgi:hypothetical protein